MGDNRFNASSSAPRIERKIIEKNRRNKMKNLYNNLMSLLPNNVAKQGMPIPDQIDEAVEYIKCLNAKLQSLRQKKESLLQPITNSHVTNREDNICYASSSSSRTLVQVQDMGPHVDVIVANGLSSYSSFSSMISSLVHRQHYGVEIASASFCKDGNSSIQVLKADKVEKSVMGSGPSSAGSGMNKEAIMINENSKIEQSESHDLNLWDYEIDDNTCVFKI